MQGPSVKICVRTGSMGSIVYMIVYVTERALKHVTPILESASVNLAGKVRADGVFTKAQNLDQS